MASITSLDHAYPLHLLLFRQKELQDYQRKLKWQTKDPAPGIGAGSFV
jgi:hypothetical protein